MSQRSVKISNRKERREAVLRIDADKTLRLSLMFSVFRNIPVRGSKSFRWGSKAGKTNSQIEILATSKQRPTSNSDSASRVAFVYVTYSTYKQTPKGKPTDSLYAKKLRKHYRDTSTDLDSLQRFYTLRRIYTLRRSNAQQWTLSPFNFQIRLDSETCNDLSKLTPTSIPILS
ncbi:hypothetical protein TNCV_162161 [Trichonephila clavipes]|nr:hypothetical protein TNCV_162161 [Trichonephila clavipes]